MEEKIDNSVLDSVADYAEITMCDNEIACCEEEVETDELAGNNEANNHLKKESVAKVTSYNNTSVYIPNYTPLDSDCTVSCHRDNEVSTSIINYNSDQNTEISAVHVHHLQECDTLIKLEVEPVDEEERSPNDGQIDIDIQECDKVITLPNPEVEHYIDECKLFTLSQSTEPTQTKDFFSETINTSSPEPIYKLEVVSDEITVNNDSSSPTTFLQTTEVVNKDRQPPRTPHLPPCRICGEKASGFHYGVNTCEACKGFFRRSIKRVTEYKCVESDNKCVIEPGKRNVCPKCRFDKCIKVGMSKSAIKTGRYTHEKRSQDIREIKSLERIEKTQHHIYDTFPTNNSIDEVKELVNTLIKAQKEMYGVNYDYWTNDEMINKLTQDCFRQHRAKTDIFGDLDKLPEDEFNRFYNTTGIDIDNRIELMSEIATSLENGISRYINFVKHIPGFSSLSLDDQAALIKAARFEFWFVGYQRFVCTELGVTTGILKQTHHKSELFKVVGSEFVEALFQHSEKIQSLHLTVEDIAILRSFLVVSPDRCTLQDREAVESIQWKMMTCLKYMCDTHHKDDNHFLSKVIDKITSLRELTEMNEKRAQSIKLEWPILKNHPLLVELMSG